jgi:hypothetical protein
MIRTNFTKMPVLSWAFLTLLLLSMSYTEAAAQPMVCNNMVQVSVEPIPNTCEATINADMILEGNPLPGVNYGIVIKKGLVTIVSGTNQVTITNSSIHFGATLTATITNLSNGNSCWGQLTLEDKLPPVITCTDITVNCSANLNTVGIPTAVDNCDATPTVQLTNEVVNSAGLCANGYVTIVRTYIAFDDYGNTSAPCNRTIYIQRPTAVDFPNDIIWTCNQYSAFSNITAATALHPYITDTKPATSLIIDVNLDPNCDDNDQPFNDLASVNSTNTANGGNGCPGGGLDDADVLQLTGSGVVANIIGQYCNYQQTHHDDILQTCGNTFKIIRTWTVLDWCTGSVITTGVGGEDNIQVIKVLDEVNPTITRAPFTVNVTHPGQHPQVCKSQGFLLPATFSDNCNSVVVKIYTPVGEAIYTSGGNGNNGGLIPSPGLPIGVHNVNYVATDACGNQTTLVVPVTVVDNTAPVAICDEITDVNLSTDGYATVFAQTFDDGSHDNCCLDKFEVRRMTDPCNDGHNDLVFGPSVVFCCADLTGGPVTVVFRAFDCNGNYNDCMVTVNVNDKLPPTLVSCPPNQRITCDNFATNYETQLQGLTGAQQCQVLSSFGSPVFFDNCEAIVTCNTNINLDQCLEGTISRTWSAKDPSNNNGTQTCTQTIFVDHVSDWVVEFPADITVNCGTTVPDFGEPEIFFETCELVGVSHNDVLYTVVPDACYKIQRTWTVINWCVVGASIDQEVVESSERAFQIAFPLEPCDFDGDGDCDTRTFRDSWRTSPKSKPGAAQATQSTDPDTDPDSDPWDGYITYQQVIKVNDTVDPVFANGCQIPDVCIDGNSCGATLLLPTPVINDCSPNVTITAQVRIGGVWLNGFGPYLNVAPGTYEVKYNAKDNCNNQKDCNTTVTVKDCKKPTPYCKNGLVIELMQTGMVQIWANDFNAGSFDNCTPQGQLKISFSANVNDTGKTFDCNSLGQQPIQMWVTDLAGNQDYCETFVIIQDNMNACGNGGNPLVNLGGAIADESNSAVSNVTVNMSGQSTGSVLTNTNGAYNFPSIPAGNDVTVSPVKDTDPLNGVTTFDLVLISKHILGIQLLNSPYKIIAADANKSNSVTTFDLVEIRKLILQITPNFTNNTSWRFVNKSYVFPTPANPFSQQFPEVVNINDISASVLNADFVAVKVGDVNGSAATNFTGGSNEDRTSGTFIMSTDDRFVQKGEVVTVEFSAADLDVMGYQFTLNFDKNALEMVELLPGLAKEENFGFTLLDKGAITASWNGDANNNKLFSVVFRATASGQLSSLVSLNSRFTTAEAYTTNGDLMDVQLSFNGNAANSFALYQNTPNPFKGVSVIGFNLPEAGTAKLTISDVSGKILNVIESDFAKGYNEVRINSNDLPSYGVLYYTLKTATETATKKMVVVE